MNNQLSTGKQRSVAGKQPDRNFFSTLFNLLDISKQADFQQMEPKIEVSENKNNIVVTAEIPGVNEKDIDLRISANGYLTISGEKKHESTEISANNGYFSEISYGRVSRTIPLPWDIAYEKASADYNNGILTITLPKTASGTNKQQKININTMSASKTSASKNKSATSPAPTTPKRGRRKNK